MFGSVITSLISLGGSLAGKTLEERYLTPTSGTGGDYKWRFNYHN